MFGGKFRDGITGTGRSTANWSEQDADQPFVTRVRKDVMVRKTGPFTNIHQNPQPLALDGFFSLGATTDQGTRIVASPDGYLFGDRGPAPYMGGFTLTSLAFYGKGLGMVTSDTVVGHYVDFDGRSCTAYNILEQTTRNGRTLTPINNIAAFVPYGVTSQTLTIFMRGTYWNNEGDHVFSQTVHAAQMMYDAQHVQNFILDDGFGNFYYGGVLYLHNQLGWYPDPVQLGPGAVMKMDRYLRPTYSPTIVDVPSCPGLFFCYTTDMGQSWQPCSSSAMFDDELATLTGMPVDTPGQTTSAARFNAGVAAAELLGAPLTRTLSVALAVVPYMESNLNKAKVKLGLIDLNAGCSLTETAVLFDGSVENASAFVRGLIAIPGGVLIFTRYVDPTEGNVYNNGWQRPTRVRFTPNGTDLVDRPDLPLQQNYTGVPIGYDKNTMVCPMWDGEHSLYRSRDYAQTWKRIGTICDHGVPPADGQIVMQDFPYITFLQKAGLFANASPLVPWFSDSRLPDPPPR